MFIVEYPSKDVIAFIIKNLRADEDYMGRMRAEAKIDLELWKLENKLGVEIIEECNSTNFEV